jgi:hypothetical protein
MKRTVEETKELRGRTQTHTHRQQDDLISCKNKGRGFTQIDGQTQTDGQQTDHRKKAR